MGGKGKTANYDLMGCSLKLLWLSNSEGIVTKNGCDGRLDKNVNLPFYLLIYVECVIQILKCCCLCINACAL